MATNPLNEAVRDITDYLFAIDPSGQHLWGYAWDHCGKRPDNIYDVHGSGQCLDNNGNPSGEFKLFAKEFVETARIPVMRNPLRMAGPGYDIFGAAFGLVPVSGHSVFLDNVPVINWSDGDQSNNREAPVDLRYDPFRNVWTAPYNAFPVTIQDVAPSGKAWDYLGNFINTPWNYYSVASGTYRYRILPYTSATAYDTYLANYGSGYMNNIQERNGDTNFLVVNDVVTAFVNYDPIASGTLLCNSMASRWCRLA